MERAILAQQIRAAVTSHELWRTHLVSAVLTGRAHQSLKEARRDDLCDFGRWLARLGELPEVPQVEPVRELHARFHLEAAEVLELALMGKRSEATLALGAGTRFDEASLRLSAALRDWAAAV
jgi:hypothetical protein